MQKKRKITKIIQKKYELGDRSVEVSKVEGPWMQFLKCIIKRKIKIWRSICTETKLRDLS